MGFTVIDRFIPGGGEHDDPDELRRKRLLVVSAFLLACAAFFFAAQALRFQGGANAQTYVFGVGGALALGFPILLRWTGSRRLVGTLLSFEFLLITGLSVLNGNGFEGPALLWLPAVPLLAAFLVDQRLGLAMAALVVAELAGFYLLDHGGYPFPRRFSDAQVAMLDLLGLSLLTVLLAFLGWIYERQTIGGLLRMNEELRRSEQRLIEARDHAEAMNRLKDVFVANMSHELRTPLTGVIGAADILADEVAEEHRELVGFILRGGHRLKETVGALMVLAELEGDMVSLRPEGCDLGEEAARAVERVRARAAERGLRLLLAPAGAPVPVRLDRTALARVLDSVLDNAVKFTMQGTVTVAVGIEGGQAVARVSDTGVGISAAFLPYVFEAFRQESEGHARDFEGSGLGLTVAHRLAALLGGRIDITSEKGHGSDVRLAFPLDPAARASTRRLEAVHAA